MAIPGYEERKKDAHLATVARQDKRDKQYKNLQVLKEDLERSITVFIGRLNALHAASVLFDEKLDIDALKADFIVTIRGVLDA